MRFILQNPRFLAKSRKHTLMTTHVNMEETRTARFAMRCASWAEKWFPDSWVFAVVGIFIVVLAAFAIGAPVQETSKAFGKGFWSLIPFTMQMAFVVIGGYVVASSKPASKLIQSLARVPKTGRGAVAPRRLQTAVRSQAAPGG